MNRKRKRRAELVGFLVLYGVAYLLIIGPAVGAALPGFDDPALNEPDPAPAPTLPDTA